MQNNSEAHVTWLKTLSSAVLDGFQRALAVGLVVVRRYTAPFVAEVAGARHRFVAGHATSETK
jgi:hypothetical protein